MVRQLLANACQQPIITTQCSEPALLGSAILGTVAGDVASTVHEAMTLMAKLDRQFKLQEAYRQKHQSRYESYKLLQQTAKATRNN